MLARFSDRSTATRPTSFRTARACTLTVRLHHLANRSSDIAVQYLCRELIATEPGLQLVYELGSEENPGDQEV